MNNRTLTIEKSDDGHLWGRTYEEDNLISDSATNEEELVAQMKQLLYDFHGIEPETVVFEVEYDLEAFFEHFDFLKITKIAEVAGINGSLMRQYATGSKYPGKKQTEKIENAVRMLGQKMSKVSLLQSA